MQLTTWACANTPSTPRAQVSHGDIAQGATRPGARYRVSQLVQRLNLRAQEVGRKYGRRVAHRHLRTRRSAGSKGDGKR